MANNGSIRVCLILCTIILASTALYFASSIFAPLAFALFILAIVWPLQKALQDVMPKGAALFVTLSLTIVVMLLFGSMVGWALRAIAEWLLNNVQRFQALYVHVTDWLESTASSSPACWRSASTCCG